MGDKIKIIHFNSDYKQIGLTFILVALSAILYGNCDARKLTCLLKR